MRLTAALDASKDWFSVSSSENARQVLHFGYMYNYGSGGKLEAAPEFSKDIAWLRSKIRETHLASAEFALNQCIVNKYLPGQGIAAHTDKNSFDDCICCVTIGSGATMEFTKNGCDPVTLYTAPRSLYVMSGEARYDWKHGMKSRKSDVVNGEKRLRGTRFSLTYRTVKNP